jgi:hypothetical protein
MYGIILFVVTFWLLAIVGVTGGILLFFNINLFHSEEN